MVAIIVTGLPGSGKTTLATALATRLRLPLVCKDLLKETLYDAMGDASPDGHTLGRAAFPLMYAIARNAPEMVMESFFRPGISEPELVALDRPLIQVHCSCPADVARARFLARSASGERHVVHREMDDWERFTETNGLLTLPGPLITVDTSVPVDLESTALQVLSVLEQARAGPVA